MSPDDRAAFEALMRSENDRLACRNALASMRHLARWRSLSESQVQRSWMRWARRPPGVLTARGFGPRRATAGRSSRGRRCSSGAHRARAPGRL